MLGRRLCVPLSPWQGLPGATRGALSPSRCLQKALVLDQDCTVLADQEVRLENRVTFE